MIICPVCPNETPAQNQKCPHFTKENGEIVKTDKGRKELSKLP